MKISCPKYYGHMETALKEAGLKVEKIVKQGKKTVITVVRYARNEPESQPKKPEGKIREKGIDE